MSMLASGQTVSEFTLPAVDVRALGRRGALAALAGVAVLAVALLAGGPIHAFADALRRGRQLNPGWAMAGAVFECFSLAGYVALLSLVAGRATARVGRRESAQITLAGVAATRLLPTAGAGGAGLTLWALRRAGLKPLAAARTLLAFLVLLYAVFLGSLVIAGAMLTLGLVGAHGPAALSAIPAVAATLAIALCLVLASRSTVAAKLHSDDLPRRDRRAKLQHGAQLLGDAVREGLAMVRSGDRRLAGAVAYWMFDASVMWAMLHAFGSPPVLPVVALAYLVGQVANTIPLPGSVTGGMTGVLIAFGVPVGLALPSVLAYRTIAVWLPLPVALAALPGLRTTVARWRREDNSASTDA